MDIDRILLRFDELISEAQNTANERDIDIQKTGESIISPVGYYKLLSSAIVLLTYLQAQTYLDLTKSLSLQDRINPGILQGILARLLPFLGE